MKQLQKLLKQKLRHLKNEEINFKNMSSKILPNFYIAGEVLNIDAVTGGFNFQACWSEAWLIAQDLNSLAD